MKFGLEYGLDNYAPVDEAGKFTEDVEHFAGQFVFDANDNVIKKLDEVGALMGHVPMQHSYPHCWRCKKPIIFRSTEQWFISMEKTICVKKRWPASTKLSGFPPGDVIASTAWWRTVPTGVSRVRGCGACRLLFSIV